MAAEEKNTERTSVRTYVPAYQRDIWDEHADELDMSRSEFVRSMVQAGRRGFDPRGSTPETPQTDAEPAKSANGDQPEPATDGSFDELVVELLAEDECLSWEALFEELTDDVEQRLDDTLQRLQDENRVQHSGRQGGYVLIE